MLFVMGWVGVGSWGGSLFFDPGESQSVAEFFIWVAGAV